jgi:ABC-type uncharacterized transport system permease subunit
MLLFVSIVKALSELAGLALLGQGLLFFLAGARREQNMFYGILKILTGPVLKIARLITPRFVIDQHVGFVAFLLVAIVWYFAASQKLHLCLTEYRDNPTCTDLVQKFEERASGGGG